MISIIGSEKIDHLSLREEPGRVAVQSNDAKDTK